MRPKCDDGCTHAVLGIVIKIYTRKLFGTQLYENMMRSCKNFCDNLSPHVTLITILYYMLHVYLPRNVVIYVTDINCFTYLCMFSSDKILN